MSFSRREFMQVLAVASATGMALNHRDVLAAAPGAGERLYDVPKFGNVSFLHFTDCHAQLTPIHFREPSVNLGVADAVGRPPHIVGEKLLKQFGIKPGSAQAHAFSYLDFSQAAKTYGKVGGFSHLATLVKQLKASRPNALLLDGGDTWQGSATSLWTNGQDMVDACQMVGVNMLTSHWELSFGARRVQE
ncbi:MAG: thiosulfohydrolase SoxB, partial [Hydrogenophaga sp.]|nr:thiosulfohydrolase SoxB [Hydrogenophaga sp.]